jgi:hypothetical protein
MQNSSANNEEQLVVAYKIRISGQNDRYVLLQPAQVCCLAPGSLLPNAFPWAVIFSSCQVIMHVLQCIFSRFARTPFS